MNKAIIYIPNKNPMQSGIAKNNKWVLEFKTKDPTKNYAFWILIIALVFRAMPHITLVSGYLFPFFWLN